MLADLGHSAGAVLENRGLCVCLGGGLSVYRSRLGGLRGRWVFLVPTESVGGARLVSSGTPGERLGC